MNHVNTTTWTSYCTAAGASASTIRAVWRIYLVGRAGLSAPLLRELGPEPLSDEFSGAGLHALSRGRKGAVKNFIMDGKIVVGVGNIYASEALFMAGIHPSVLPGGYQPPVTTPLPARYGTYWIAPSAAAEPPAGLSELRWQPRLFRTGTAGLRSRGPALLPLWNPYPQEVIGQRSASIALSASARLILMEEIRGFRRR